MWKNRENIAKFFFVIFIFSIVISCACLVCNFEHDCIGECCNVCYEINVLKSAFDNLIILLVFYVLIKSFIFYIVRLKYTLQINYCLSPVKLKVKILN